MSDSLWCPRCSYTTNSANALWQHLRKKHPGAEKESPSEGEDSDMVEMYRAMKEHNREKRAKNLASANPTGWKIHCETHWSRIFLGDRLDYWPTRKKFRWRQKTHVGDIAEFMAEETRKLIESYS